MGILSSSVSITQYQVEGKIEPPIMPAIAKGLIQNAVAEIDDQSSDKAVGWACFNEPFSIDFDHNPFLIGSHFVFSMRIDKKTIPAKVIKKHYALEIKKRLARSGREFLSKTEKKRDQRSCVADSEYENTGDTPYLRSCLGI